MKRIIKILLLSVILVSLLTLNVEAETLNDLGESSGAYSISDNLPEEVKDALEKLGIDNKDFSSIQNLSFNDVLSLLAETVSVEARNALPTVCIVLAMLLIYSLFNGVFDTMSNSPLSSVLSLVSVLCIASAIIIPVTDLFRRASEAIKISADFMLAFIPVMTAIMISSGHAITGSGYSAMMILAAEAVGQFFSKVISPLLSVLLTLGVSTSVVPEINLSSISGFFSKSVKWLMSFIFMIFTAFLTLKSMFASSVDNVSSRALRYTVSSFVPVVGGALSEAYRTIHGSVGVLKSGVGVFVIISVLLVFMPVLIKLLIWLFTVNMCKSVSQISSLSGPSVLFESVSTVLSLTLSVIFCIISLFVITTALIITIGGN